MLENVDEGLNEPKCVGRLNCSKMCMKAKMLENVCGCFSKMCMCITAFQKCACRLKCSKMCLKP